MRAVLVDAGPLVALLDRSEALVHAAEREDVRRILTLDQRDFGVYRRSRKGRFTLLP